MRASKTIRVPSQLHYALRERAKAEKRPIWEIILRAWSYWSEAWREHHKAIETTDKAAWYIFKLSSSVGELKAQPNAVNLSKLEKTLEQISKRLRIDTSFLRDIANRFWKRPSRKNRMALNDTTKMIIIQMIRTIESD